MVCMFFQEDDKEGKMVQKKERIDDYPFYKVFLLGDKTVFYSKIINLCFKIQYLEKF